MPDTARTVPREAYGQDNAEKETDAWRKHIADCGIVAPVPCASSA